MGFQENAESQITTALGAQLAPAAEAILRELEALRVAFDVRYEGVTETVALLRSASPGWLHEVIHRLARAAGEEAEAAAQVAQGQVVEQAQACLEFERAQAKERLELAQSEAAAQREADRREQAALREALEEARAQVDALRTDTRAQLEAARAEQTRLLEQSRAQISAAREEAERAATAHRQLVDDLRAQLEQARADLQQARADADRVEKLAPAQPEAVQTELGARKQPGAPTQVTPAEALGGVRAQLDRPTGSAREEVQPARDPQAQPPALRRAEHEAARDDRFAPMFSALDEAATLTHALDAVLDGVGAAYSRAALFLVKSDKLQGWRSVGFESEALITSQFEFPLAVDSVLTRAATTRRTIVTGNGLAPEARPVGAAHEPWAVALPVTVGDRVVAVVYADEGAQGGNRRPPLDREVALDVSERLAGHAGRRLAAIMATDRIGDSDFKPEVPTTPGVSATSTEQTRPAEPVRIDDAQRYARLLMSEMKRYHEADVATGSSDGNLSKRLKDEIERCRRLYATRVPLEARSTVNLLDEAIFEMFGGADVDVLRPIEKAGGAPAVGAGIDRPAPAGASPRVGT